MRNQRTRFVKNNINGEWSGDARERSSGNEIRK